MRRFEYDFKLGKAGEQLIEDWLRENGWRFLFESGAVVRGDECFVYDVKMKDRWVRFPTPDSEPETGINENAYVEYLAVARRRALQGEKCALFFVHINAYDDAGVWSLADLSTPPRVWDGLDPSGRYVEPPIALWRRSVLTQEIGAEETLLRWERAWRKCA